MVYLPSITEIERLHHKYAPNDIVYDLVYRHCQIVSDIASWCAENSQQKLDMDLLKKACLLHDIGSYAFFDANGQNLNERLYPQHAILGSKILQDEGIDSRLTDIVETHVLLGLTKSEIINTPWYLPERDYVPSSIEGELLCYADRFHSKHPTFNSYTTFLNGLKKDLPLQAQKFELWSSRFGIPDIATFALKYGHPIR